MALTTDLVSNLGSCAEKIQHMRDLAQILFRVGRKCPSDWGLSLLGIVMEHKGH